MNDRIVFMGTPDFAARHLSGLIDEKFNIVGVFSQPDKASGRGKKLRPTPVKIIAEEAGIPVYQPKTVNKGVGFSTLEELKPDVIIVVAYGKILGNNVINLPTKGIYNIHASLLPKFRGAAPIQRAIESGDEKTGSCLMGIVKELDAGPVFSRCEVDIYKSDNFDSVCEKLCSGGMNMLVSFLNNLEKNTDLVSEPQPAEGITYAEKITKSELFVDWNKSSFEIHNKIRAFDSTPGAVSYVNGLKIKLFESVDYRNSVSDTETKHGSILEINKKGAWIKCGTGDVFVKSIQFPGKKPMSFFAAKNGRKITDNDIFENELE